MPKEINRALLVLIPKVENACSVKEYRPIACCTVLYKIISKVLANRLQGVLQTIISESQSAFVKGRIIFDNIILSHEIVKGYNRKGVSPRCMIKVDLQKAYDSVEWPFIKYLMLYLGFPYTFVEWIMSCLNTVSYTISVNGELTMPFEARKGLRQGDPISPYLFVLGMEYLNRCCMELYTNRLFRFHPRCKRMGLVHMCFVDDLLLFTRGDVQSIQQLLHVFQKFTEVSGLKANQTKSSIYFGGVSEDVKRDILILSGMTQGQLPFKYLGVPLSTQKLSVVQCKPLIKKILERIDCWASKLLSYAGRVQLIKSVLYGMQFYWCQIFLLPQKVIKLVQTACRTFLWTGKSQVSRRALVAWDTVCLPKHEGGLGLVNLKIWNKAAICKMMWSLAKKKDKIWIRWIHGYYIKEQDVMSMATPMQSSWVIRKIMGARDDFQRMQGDVEWLSKPSVSIGQLYNALRGGGQRVAWSKLICCNKAPPKYLFISWLVMNNSMVTCEKLMRMGVNVNPVCCFCGRNDETLDHLFFECQFTSQVWVAVTTWSGVMRRPKSWSQEKEFLFTQCKTNNGKQSMYRCVLSIVIYEVWKERNARRMQNSTCSIEYVSHACKRMVAWSCRNEPKLKGLIARQ